MVKLFVRDLYSLAWYLDYHTQKWMWNYKNRNEYKKDQIREVKYGYQEVNAYVHSCPRLEEVEN